MAKPPDRPARNRPAGGGRPAPPPRPGAPSAQGRAPLVLRLLAAAGVAGVLAVACALFRYPHAMADDYTRAGRVRLYGPAGATAWEYRNWSGRWAGIGASCLLWGAMDLSDPWNYRLTLIALAALCSAAVHFFLCSVLDWRPQAPRALACTLAFGALYWAGMLAPGEALYWLPAALEYQFGGAGILFVAGGLARLGRARAGARCAWLAILLPVAAVLPGMHELLGLVLCMLLALGACLAIWKKAPSRWSWLAIALAAAVGMAFVIAAPGNAVRRAESHRSMGFSWADVSWALHFLLARLGEFLPVWFSDGRLWAATLLLLLAPRPANLCPPWLARKDIAWLFWVPAAWAAVTVAMLFLPPLASGEHLPYRTYNSIYLVFLVAWFLTALAIRGRQETRAPPAPRPGGAGAFLPAAWLALLLTLFLLHGRAAGDNMPKPTQVYSRLAMAVAWMATFYLLAIRTPGGLAARRGPVLWAVLLVAWPAALLWTGNVPRAFQDLTQSVSLDPAVRKMMEPYQGTAWAQARRTRLEWFDLQMQQRRDFIHQQAAAGRKLIMVPPIIAGPGLTPEETWPRTFYRLDLAPDPNYWTNRELCPFFGIDRIVLGARYAAQ